MGFQNRKFLPEKPLNSSKKDKEDRLPKKDIPCYVCYYCPEGCNKDSPDEYLPHPPLPPHPSEKNSQISTILILMLCVLGAAFVFLCYFTIIKYRSRNSRRRNSIRNNVMQNYVNENHGPVLDHPIWYIRTVGLPQSVIDSIAVFKYKKGENLIEGTDCSVCLAEFEEDQSLRILPKCTHAFHVPCIDTWLRSHKNCPLCRAPVVCGPGPVETSLGNSGSVEEEDESGNELGNEEVERNEPSEAMVIGALSVDQVEGQERKSLCCGNERRNCTKFRVLSDLANERVTFGEHIQPVRRSVSMDFDSASLIYNTVGNVVCPVKDEGCSDSKIVVEKHSSDMISRKRWNSSVYKLIKSSSYKCSLSKGPIMMKRSLSFSAKHTLSKGILDMVGE